jgi:opacity protein-like surface antigen
MPIRSKEDMRRSLVVVIMVMAAASMAVAQDVTKIELFGGYSALIFGSRDTSNLVSKTASTLPPTFTVLPNKFFKNGGSVSAVINVTQNIGIEGNAQYNVNNLMKGYGTLNGSIANARLRVSDFSCFIGPRIVSRKNERITPFAHILLGVNRFQIRPSYSAGGVDRRFELGIPAIHDNAFAFMAGGGLDVKVNKTIAVRLVQADFIMANNTIATTPKTDLSLKNVNLSMGVVFHLGGKK